MLDVDNLEPPMDPNDWTDDQWLEWLKATDDPTDESVEPLTKVFNRVIKSAPGQALGQAMLGVAQAIYGRQNDGLEIVVSSASATTDDEPFSVRLDPDHPERSSVVLNPEPNSSRGLHPGTGKI